MGSQHDKSSHLHHRRMKLRKLLVSSCKMVSSCKLLIDRARANGAVTVFMIMVYQEMFMIFCLMHVFLPKNFCAVNRMYDQTMLHNVRRIMKGERSPAMRGRSKRTCPVCSVIVE